MSNIVDGQIRGGNISRHGLPVSSQCLRKEQERQHLAQDLTQAVAARQRRPWS